MTESVAKHGLTARNRAHAEELIAAKLKAFFDGGRDEETSCVTLALIWGIDADGVREGFAEAREFRKKQPIPVAAQPKVILVHRRRLVIDAKAESKIGDREAIDVAIASKPELKVEPEPTAKAGLPMVLPPPKAPVPWDDVIDAMNARHAIIDNVGGKTVIAGWEPSQLDPERMVVLFQQKESFLLRYSNRTATVDVPDGHGGIRQSVEALGGWWLKHRQRRQHRGITFLPDGPEIVNDCLNIWQGWGVKAQAGDWSLIREHIEVVLAGGNEEFAEYIIRWIAWGIQNPAAQAEVALVLIGPKGAGKGTLVRCLQRIFGAHAFQVTSREEVIGKFNGHLQDCVLFVADEAYWAGISAASGGFRE
jgi:hypothetical protein